MNNSFSRLIDGMCATLRSEVLTRLDDEFARGQVFGVINLLNTFKVRADWSPTFLREQVAAQREALAQAHAALQAAGAGALPPLPGELPPEATVAQLLAQRDRENQAIGELLAWIEASGGGLPAPATAAALSALRQAMRREVDLELKYAPRPLFAEMSSGRED